METYLAHHGILGKKWGIRQYQNEDGTLTEAGKARAKKVESSNRFSKRDTKNAKKAIRESIKSNSVYADFNINKAAKAKSVGDDDGAQKYTSKAELYALNAARFIDSNKELSKKLSEISDGTLKVGRDFFIQTDLDIGIFADKITKTVIDVKK